MIGILLCLSTSLGATNEESATQTDSIAPEDLQDDCYCSVRKRKQVEMRLKKKKESEQQDKPGTTSPQLN